MAEFLVKLARLRVPLGFASGLLVLIVAHPTWSSLAWGTGIAAIGQAIRVWAAGHLEKSREVTRSGPYRWNRHPLYVGSSVMGIGIAVAGANLMAGTIIAIYLGATLTAAVRTEEAFLRGRFGTTYDDYCRGAASAVDRPFAWARAWRNREWRSVLGMAAVFLILAAKAAWIS